LLNKLESQLNKYENQARLKSSPEKASDLRGLRAQNNPQSIWIKYKENILKVSTQATQKHHAETTKLCKIAEKT